MTNEKKNTVDKIYDIPLEEYLEYVQQIPDVTDEEVLQYYNQIIEAGKAEKKLSEPIDEHTDHEYRKELEEKVTAGGEAKQNLIESKFGLVATMAKQFVGQGASMKDLIREGNQGVGKAVENLIENNPETFNKMVPSWIRQRMERLISKSFQEESSEEE